MSEPKTITRSQASREAKRLWERLRDTIHNEEAWAEIDSAFDEIRNPNPCRCKIGKRYKLNQTCGCEDK